MGRQYHIKGNINVSQHDKSEVADALESYVREGARQMLVVAMEEEVSAFLGRNRYERKKGLKGYRIGSHQARVSSGPEINWARAVCMTAI